MKYLCRRNFLTVVVKGSAVGLLGFIPGTFFNSRKVFAADAFEKLLKGTSKENLQMQLKRSTLPLEDKAAVLAAKELNRSELKSTLNALNKKGSVAIGTGCGQGCGTGCGGGCGGAKNADGNVCGFGCTPVRAAKGVLDRSGRMGINFGKLNMNKFRTSLQRALQLSK